MIPVNISNVLEQAKQVAATKRATISTLELTLITPELHYPVPNVQRLSKSSNFLEDGTDVWAINFLMQPGVFLKQILPYKDNLLVDLVESTGLNRTLRRLRATIPMDVNPQTSSDNSVYIDPGVLDQNMVVPVTLILIDTVYEQLRNQPLLDNYLMATTKDVLHNVWSQQGHAIQSNGVNKFKGVDIEEPTDNPRVYRQIMVKHGTRLTRFADYLQNEEGLGIYTRGCGSFYRDGIWYVFPICKPERYGTVKKSLDIYKFPEDVLPVTEQTYGTTANSTLILSTGPSKLLDGTDNLRQNFGAGQQIISSDAIAGEVGSHYNNGASVTLRAEKVTEYRTTQRASGQELIDVNATPTNNVFKEITKNAMRDCKVLELNWTNSNPFLVTPGAPVKYYFLNEQGTLTIQEGTVISEKTTYYSDSTRPLTPFRKNSILTILLLPIQNTTITPNN